MLHRHNFDITDIFSFLSKLKSLSPRISLKRIRTEHRKLPRGEEKLSIIGLGSGSLGLASEEEIIIIIKETINSGINFFDLCAGNHKVYKPFGKAIKGVREKVHFQFRFGAFYKADGEYGWSRDLNKIKSTRKEEFDYSLIG